jgi:DNA-binding PadR family transcriptional regulator
MARIAVFKGRDARLNKAIFWILAQQSPLTIYDMWRKLRTRRDFTYIPYNTVNRRVRALEEHGFVEKSGERKTKTGFVSVLYQLTPRVYLAIVLDRLDIDDFIEKAPEAMTLTVLSALICTEF